MKHTWYIYAVAAALILAAYQFTPRPAPAWTPPPQERAATDNLICTHTNCYTLKTVDGQVVKIKYRKGDEINNSIANGEIPIPGTGWEPETNLRRGSCAEDRAATADLDSGVDGQLGPPLSPSAVGLDLRGGQSGVPYNPAGSYTAASAAPLLPGEGCEGCTYSGGGMAPVSKDLDGDGAPDLTMNLLVLKQSDGTCAQSPGCPHGQDCWSSEKAGAVLPNGWSYYLEVLRCDGSLDHDHLGAVNNSGAPKSFPGSIDTSHGVECDDCGKYRLRAEPASGPPIYSGVVTTNCSDCTEEEG